MLDNPFQGAQVFRVVKNYFSFGSYISLYPDRFLDLDFFGVGRSLAAFVRVYNADPTPPASQGECNRALLELLSRSSSNGTQIPPLGGAYGATRKVSGAGI